MSFGLLKEGKEIHLPHLECIYNQICVEIFTNRDL